MDTFRGFAGKRVLVSGGAGVIGTALVERLHEAGARLWVGDLEPRPAGWDSAIDYWQGDLNTIDPGILQRFAPEYFFHLAATFERSTETPGFWEENFQHNVQLSHRLMSALKDTPALRRVVFASSYLIYDPMQYQFPEPAAEAVRLREDSPVYPRNLCGTAKLMHEQELAFLSHTANGAFTTVSARIFRSYGKNSRDIISRWVRALLNSEPITVYRPEGLFDYIYADDVAEGLLYLARSQSTGHVNLGRGNARRVAEVIDALKSHFPQLVAQTGESDIPCEASEADMTAFESLTGWAPRCDIETVIPELIAFEQTRRAPHPV